MIEALQKDPEAKFLYYQEKLILDVTETIAKLMHKHKVSKSDLAKRLGKERSQVTQLLDGTSNMTLRTVSDFFVALDSMLIPTAGALSLGCGHAYDDSYYEFSNENRSVESGSDRKELCYGMLGSTNYTESIAA